MTFPDRGGLTVPAHLDILLSFLLAIRHMEIIPFGEPEPRQAPLLFLHGAYCGAWIWERYFLPYFAEQGFYGAAMSLRAHGRNEDKSALDLLGVDDFLDDIARAVATFDTPPVLIGHSMGGYLAQRYALDHPLTALVLLASPALTGLAAASQHIITCHPALAAQLGILMTCGPHMVDVSVIAQALCTSPQSVQEAKEFAALLQPESKRVTSEIMWPYFCSPTVGRPPTLVVGGDRDAFVPVTDFRYEAISWDAKLRILPAVPHGMMMDQSWPIPANEIVDWLRGLNQFQSSDRHSKARHSAATAP